MMRPEIREFAEKMEEVMSMNDPKKGESWKTCSIEFLEQKLDEEYSEYRKEGDFISDFCLDPEKELVDIANVCMMLWNRLKG